MHITIGEPMKPLFLNPPTFEDFDGGAGARYQASREVTSFWYPTWLCFQIVSKTWQIVANVRYYVKLFACSGLLSACICPKRFSYTFLTLRGKTSIIF